MKVTAEQVREAVQKSGRTFWPLHSCSICKTPVGYIFNGDYIGYSSACDCTRYDAGPRPSSWQDLADTVNRQTDEVSERMMRELSDQQR